MAQHSRKEEIAWAAGLFEGEGCWTPMRSSARHAVRIFALLSMTDKDVVEHFHLVVGVGKVYARPRKQENPRYTDQWVWRTNTLADTRSVYELLAPWLHARRLQRFEELRAERLAYEQRQPEIYSRAAKARWEVRRSATAKDGQQGTT